MDEDHPAKRIKLIKDEENSKSCDDCAVNESVEDANTEECSLCLHCSSLENPILPNHMCPQCSANSWKVCQCCHELLLSRSCPICRGDYAPIVMYTVPGPSFVHLANTTLVEEEKANLLYKFGIIRQLIGKSNVCVWSPKSKRMYFSLPERAVSTDGPSDEGSFAIVSIQISDDKVSDDKFLFTNKIWDVIENEVEHGEIQAGEMVNLQRAIQWILSITKENDHKLYTMMNDEDWNYMLNPNESADTVEALKAIRNTILQPLLKSSNENKI